MKPASMLTPPLQKSMWGDIDRADAVGKFDVPVIDQGRQRHKIDAACIDRDSALGSRNSTRYQHRCRLHRS
jgi:hypothetical protein